MPERIRYEEEPESFYRRWRGGVRRAVRTSGFIAVVVYTTAQAISRTPGFRSWLANELSRRWRCTVSIGGTALSPTGILRLRDLEIASPVTAQSAVGRARNVSVRWLYQPKLYVAGGTLEWNRARRGPQFDNWLDAVAIAAAKTLDLQGLDLPLDLPSVELELDECSIAWRERDAAPAAEARNLRLLWMPLPIPDPPMTFARVSADLYEGTNVPARSISLSVLFTGQGQRWTLPSLAPAASADHAEP